jgi:hypothetical protein
VPALLGLYPTALLYCGTSARGVALAEALVTVSHDRLTRLLRGDWSGPRLLELALRARFVWARGDLSIDETVMPTPLATAIDGLARVCSGQERKPVYGRCLVLLVRTEGARRSPWGMRLWREGGPSKDELALALLS